MDIVTTLSLASAVGAGLFFISGFVASNLRRGSLLEDLEATRGQLRDAQAAIERGALEQADLIQRLETAHAGGQQAEGLEGALAELQAEATELRAKLDSHQSEADRRQRTSRTLLSTLEARVQSQTEEIARLEDQCTALKTKGTTLDVERASLNEALALATRRSADRETELRHLKVQLRTAMARLTEAEAARDEVVELRERLNRQEGDASELERVREALHDLKLELHVVQSRADRADSLQQENAELAEQLHAAAPELERLDAYDALLDERREQAIAAEVMRKRIEALAHHADHNTELRERLSVAEAGAARSAALEQRIRELEAYAFAAGSPSHPRPSIRTALSPRSSRALGTLGESLDQRLAEFARAQGCRVAVVADMSGLPLAVAGDPIYQEGLAAIPGAVRASFEPLQAALPMGTPCAIEVVDGHNVMLSSHFFQAGGDHLSLATLDVRSRRQHGPTEALLTSLETLLAAA